MRYTFYKYVYFNQGDRITISTESDTPHVTELMMYGEYTLDNPPVIVSPEDNIANALAGGSLSTLSTNVNVDPVPLPDKIWAVTRFNSETTHENNWIDHSLYTDGDGESTFLEVTSAPESAYYLIRVRTKENDQAGTARIVIRGKKTYRSEPITCSKVTCELPADSNEYLTMTASANQEDDDPMLFLHADNDSIVNMEDDCLSKWMEQYGIGKHDAVLTQKNITPIKAVSVCNYSTLQPVSSCTIISGIVVNESSSKSRGNDIVMSKTAERGANIEISASEQIDNVSVYGIYGELIGSAKVSGNEVSVPVSSLGISKSGVYIVNVQTTSGSESGRLFVK